MTEFDYIVVGAGAAGWAPGVAAGCDPCRAAFSPLTGAYSRTFRL